MHRFMIVGVVLAMVGLFTVRPAPAGTDEWLQRAGNADDDQQRLEILKQWRAAPGLDPGVVQDLDHMIAFVDRWVHSSYLPFFAGEVNRSVDYDFHIPQTSPVYPLTHLYRGRMLVWMTLESGNILRHRERRRLFLDKARAEFQKARALFPDNEIIAMYLGRPIPAAKRYDDETEAPEWARWQRQNLERLTDIILWWIDHRMQPDGQYGGGWGDDCEMWRWWSPILIGFEEPRIVAAQRRFSEALLGQDHMKLGYTSRMTDVEHTAEDSADAITPMMHLAPEDPAWQRRALRLAELMESRWTGTNERGQLQFKSTYFTVDRIDDRPERACDTVYHPRAVQPALLFWQRTRDPKLTALFSRWMDTWVDAAMRGERGKPAGIVPSAIHWPDGTVGGLGDNWWDPRNHGEPTLYEWPSALAMLNDTLLLTYHITGEDRYLRPLRSMAEIRWKWLNGQYAKDAQLGTEAWCASKLGLLAPTLAKYRLLTGSTEFDRILSRDLPAAVAGLDQDARWRLTDGLRLSAEALSVNFPGYTSEVRWTDRVLRFPALFEPDMLFVDGVPGIGKPDPERIYSLVTGDLGSPGYFPMNAVRWRTPPREIAAWVRASGADHLQAELFHFGDQLRRIKADLFRLQPGRYEVMLQRVGQATTPTTMMRFSVEEAVTQIELTLPPRTLVELRIAKRSD